MGGLFSSKQTPTQQTVQPASALRVQTSIAGKVRPVVVGVTRVPGNLIWYSDFSSLSKGGQTSGGGGKGSVFQGNQQQPSQQQQVSYFWAFELALGEAVSAIGPRLWIDKSKNTIQGYGFATFLGTDSQTAWSFLTTNHPDQALNYRLTSIAAAYLEFDSPEMPNWTFEVTGSINGAAAGIVDANAIDALADLMANEDYGIPGWSSAFNGDWSTASDYALAAGLVVSFCLVDQTAAGQLISDYVESLNCMPVWSDGVLKLVALGDQAISGNGVSYTPPANPIYSLTDDDFLPNQSSLGGGSGDDPVSGMRTAPRNINNFVEVEYLDRASDYNPATYPASDDASIRQFGRRSSKGVRVWHWFQINSAAVMAGQLALGREKIANTYSFTLSARYIGLDPGDIVSLTDTNLGLDDQWVRITKIQENQDRSLSFLATEYLAGTAAAPLYGAEANSGALPNYNESPGAVNAPIIFEPTAELMGNAQLEIWVVASGQDNDLYGGTEVWVSYDGDNYTVVSHQIGNARTGVLTAQLSTVTVNNTGPTIDTTHTLSVDLSQSEATIISGSQTDALALNTACYVDGEIIGYQNAVLTGTNRYNLTYLVRGAYGTEDHIVTHASGTKFARLDQGVIRVPFDQSRIGSTIFLKLVPFNVWGQGSVTLADVSPINYVILGTALKSPLATVENLTSKFVDGRLNITWDEIEDFRTGIRYEIRQGDTYAAAQSLGTVAHPPFPVPGDGVFWVSGWVQPVPALIVRSEFPVSLEVAGATIDRNVVATFDCKAEGWPGTFVNTGVDTGLDAVRLAGAGNILTVSNILSLDDVIAYGGIVPSGTYAPDFLVDIGRVAPCQITISMQGTGIPAAQNILDDPNILDEPDILGSASVQFTEVFAKVIISQGGAFAAGVKYSPGIYVGRKFKFEFDLSSIDPASVAVLLTAVITVDVPDRIDSNAIISSVVTSLTNLTVPAGGVHLTYVPNGFTTAASFNGGPGGDIGSLPQVVVTWGDEQPGDVLEITAETVSGCTVKILNGGVGVERNQVNIFPRGY